VQRAQSYGALGDMPRARAAAEEAARISAETGFAEGVAHANMMAGFAAEQSGDAAGAVQRYDDAIAAATDPELLSRVRSQRAGLLAGSPRAAEVVDDLVEMVADRTAAGDGEGAARARHTLAIAYLNAGRPLDSAEVAEEALAYFTRASTASGTSSSSAASAASAEEDADDDIDHILGIRHLLAAAYQRLDQPDEAIGQLEAILTACAQRDNPAGVGQMSEEIGDILDRLDRDAAAAMRYLAAAEAFHAADLAIDEMRNRRQHATSLLWAEDVPGALAALAVADEFSLGLPAGEHPAWERAMLLYDGAKILRNAGQLGEAALRAGGSANRFRAIGYGLQAAHAEMLHADLLLRNKRPADAEAAARRGLIDLPEGGEGRERLTELLDAAITAQNG
jgi:tetratricopeptide (TPR) repeat protein